MKSANWKELTAPVEDKTVQFFRGLESPRLKIFMDEGRDFLYMDNAYFHRGPRATKFRLIRKGVHLTRLLDRPDDRIKALGVVPEPWRKGGRSVLVIPASPYHLDLYGAHGWQERAIDEIRRHTDRPIVVKTVKREPLQPYLDDAWCVVTYGSVAGVEAALYGVPVFSGPICPSLPISSGPLENIESPLYPDRWPWLSSLAYAQFDISEFDRINFKDFNYRCG